MRMKIAAAMVFCATGGAVLAQTAVSPTQVSTATSAKAGGVKTFEVASVRKSPEPDMQKMMMGLSQGRRPDWSRVDGSRATYNYMSLKQLIAYAYKLRIYEVSGPEWMLTDRFDIAAKLPDGTAKDDVSEMMRALLEERFKLTTHKETKDVPVLGLMVAKGGPKLTESTEKPEEDIDPNAELKPGESRMDTVDGPMLLTHNPDGSTTYHMGPRGTFTLKFDGETRSMRMTGKAMSMRGLAIMMTSLGGGEGRQVVDQTGLQGRYDVAVDFSLMDLLQSLHDQGIDIPHGPMGGGDGQATDPGGGETMSQALSSLGLKVEKSHAVLDRLVVDHVEQEPTEQ